ncbi:phBC6A51 family helix-turn-helix protein [Halalkalibacter flavus]|uniref:phBC6A51 family helix-turn-helix protein n=1 Tax=Halalkalibacter flavus TaxID=3090668 RepID=UPI002FCB7617
MSNVLEQLETKLSTQQQKAAWLLVQNDLAGKEKKTYAELADEVGCDEKTLYNWRKKDPAFVKYLGLVSDIELDSFRAEADAMLMKLIRGGNNGLGSIKALDLYYKLAGRIVNKSEIVNMNGEEGERKQLTDSEIAERLADMTKHLN